MEKIYENIINEGKKNGKTIEAINVELKEAGANFHLNPDGGVANWTEQEMKEGFIPLRKNPLTCVTCMMSCAMIPRRPGRPCASSVPRACTTLPGTSTAILRRL